MSEGVRLDLERYGVPSRLHHYTSWAGYGGIVTSRTLRATNARHVNDEDEISYGLAACRTALGTLKDPRLQFHGRLILDGIENGFGYTPFIACFSDAEDIESQWLGYADGGRGFAIGFDGAALSAVWADPALRILPVEYDPRVQEERAVASVRRAERDLARLGDDLYRDRDYHIQSRFTLLAVELTYLCATFKSWKWHTEREWRLVYHRSEPNAIRVQKYTNASGEQVPFVAFDLTSTIDRIPRRIFSSVRVGPRVRPELAREARKLLGTYKDEVIWTVHPHDPVPTRENIFRVTRSHTA